MALRIRERFVVDAPAGPVWDFLVDPRRMVSCVPGGELEAVVDERTFDGRVRVAVGPLAFAYGGRVRLAEADAAGRRVTIVGLARERTGDGSARLTLESWLTPLSSASTAVVAIARLDVEGRIVSLGRGFLEHLAHVVFQEFADRVSATIEAEEARRAAAASGVPIGASAAPPPAPPLRAVPLVLRALRAWVAGWLWPRGPGA